LAKNGRRGVARAGFPAAGSLKAVVDQELTALKIVAILSQKKLYFPAQMREIISSQST
jgi:hypothetical protein